MPKNSKEGFKPNAKTRSYTCQQCAGNFYSNRPKVKFCSSTCRNYHWRDQKALSLAYGGIIEDNKRQSDAQTDKLIEKLERIEVTSPLTEHRDTTRKDNKLRQMAPTMVSIQDLAMQLEREIKELQTLKQRLQEYIEEEFYQIMRLQGRDTISTNIFPVLHYMEQKHELLASFARHLKQSGVYLPNHPLQT